MFSRLAAVLQDVGVRAAGVFEGIGNRSKARSS
jgi:hypothetical protein